LILSRLVSATDRSTDIFATARMVMQIVFWLNWVLIAMATGEKLFSRCWFVALLAAGTLAPLWDYGFEVRHDNLLLAGLLFSWALLRFGPPRPAAYCIAGMMAVVLQFVAFKAFVYTIPIVGLLIILPQSKPNVPRWKLVLSWIIGAAIMFGILRSIYGAAGLWGGYVEGNEGFSRVSSTGHRFGIDIAISRLLTQTPLLLALVVAGSFAVLMEFRRNGKGALNSEGILPELMLFAIAFAALVINPTPFPYNLVNLTPFAFLMVFRYARRTLDRIENRAEIFPVAVAVLVFTHLVPFWIATRRHLDMPNLRQERLMSLAEDLTDPVRDPVYDAIGMVPTRPIVDPRAFLHSLSIQSFKDGTGPKLREMLAARPAAVFIPSYRTDWLPEEDTQFIHDRYVSVSDDFWVLGKVFPEKGGAFQIFHAGRYRIAPLQDSGLSGTYPEDELQSINGSKANTVIAGTIDGKPIPAVAVELSVGTHYLECGASTQPTVVWVGPQQDRVPQIGRGDHRKSFVNWY
jgi:hypothetical protein